MSKCIHNKRKSRCKECGGNELCIHDKQKYQCKECGGSQICIHNIQKAKCKDCGGSQICIHNKFKSRCKDCGGNEFCIHNKLKNMCKECDGASICEHNRHRPHCKECKGISICEHNKRKSMCKLCGGSQICIHNIDKGKCKKCSGSQICIHNKRKEYCKECGGSGLCQTPFCDKRKIRKYNNYCLLCCIHLFPEMTVSRNYKTKEKTVVDYIKEIFSNLTWIYDKKIYDGCSKRRPDLLLDLGEQIIIIEIDENKHDNYDCICENKRLMEISQDLNHRPIIFIRFNPDKYIDNNSNIIKSCWKLNTSTGILYICKNKLNEWNDRLKILKEQVEYWIENKTSKIIEIIELFY
jgi:hypothetical protein